MLHRYLQFRKPLAQRIKHRLDEHRLAIEDVDFGRRDLTMHAKRQAIFAMRSRNGMAFSRSRTPPWVWSWRPRIELHGQ